jgi:hypothetical protein
MPLGRMKDPLLCAAADSHIATHSPFTRQSVRHRGLSITDTSTGHSLEPQPGMLAREPSMWKDSAAVSMSAFRSCHRSSLHCPLNVYSWPFLQTAFWLGVHLRGQCTRREASLHIGYHGRC